MSKLMSTIIDQVFVVLSAALISHGLNGGWQVAAGVYVIATIVLNNIRDIKK